MLAGLNSYGNTKIIESIKSRDHTENLLKKYSSNQNKVWQEKNNRSLWKEKS